jgi:hypothetical protein
LRNIRLPSSSVVPIATWAPALFTTASSVITGACVTWSCCTDARTVNGEGGDGSSSTRGEGGDRREPDRDRERP